MTANLARQLTLLPERLGWHVVLTVAALSAGVAVSLPLAVAAFRVPRLRRPVLAIAGVVQTIPSLALLALMVPLLGRIGFVPALLALVLYSMLPVLRNTVTGLAGVDPALVEAARGVGMTPRQTLWRVQLPLAAPVIVAGLRTAAVWVVGIATLSTPVGQVSLGNYIFEGLQLRNSTAVLVGCATAAGVAVALDAIVRMLETAAARRSRRMAAVAVVILVAGMGAAAAPLVMRAGGGQATVVGAKTFTEQYVLAELVGRQLDRAGFPARRARGMGSGILFESLANSSLDCYVDYTGTLWTNVMKRRGGGGGGGAVADRAKMMADIGEFLDDRYGIACVGALGFENTYALAMPRAAAERLHVRTIADLAALSPRMRIGGDYEFFARPEWRAVCSAYALSFASTVSLDSTLMYGAARRGDVDVICAFSTDGRILSYDLTVLADPRHAFPPYDAVLLVSPEARRRPGFVEALRPLVGSIDDDLMRRLNKAVDVDHATPRQAAQSVPAPAGNGA